MSPKDTAVKIYDNYEHAIKIKTVNIPMPMLEVNDNFYFEDEQIVVTIKSVMRTDKDNVVYTTNVKLVPDEESLEKYNNDKELFLNNKELLKSYQELTTELYELKSRGLIARLFNRQKKK